MRLILLSMAVIPIISSHACSFSPPHFFWPQKDMDSSSVNDSAPGKKVLVASRDSDYKRALVGKIKAAFSDDPVYVKCIGLTKLKNVDAPAYDAIVLLNTCMAWDWDRSVHKFLKGKTGASNVIVITTSATGDWKPRKNRAGVDAVAAASEIGAIEKLAEEIVGKVRRILDKN